ncbi:MAG TPA: agmatine deiminase family protein [Trueperaceae bacterium]
MNRHSPKSPFELGYRMPPEWEEHEATWVSWPFDDALWEGYLEPVRENVAGLVATILRFEPVWLNVRDRESEDDARRRLEAAGADLARLRFNRLPLNDAWFRDNGPLFVRNREGEVAMVDWVFNAWGEKYEPWDADDAAPVAVAKELGMKRFEVPIVLEGGALELNGQGVCLTTRSCLLSQHRNPEMTQDEYERVLHEQLGVMHVCWLEGGLKDDHTDGHIDTIIRFSDDHTVLCAVEEDESDPNYGTLRHNRQLLENMRDHQGKPLEVVELPLPRKKPVLEGKRLPLTYANFYVGNGFVAVPTYGDENDERALEIIRRHFPGREVIGLDAQGLITGGGAFHCITQQQPAGEVARG